MRISIITPTFNSEATILNACRSIIAQEYPDFEHILVDNQSKDGTVAIARDYYIELHKEAHLRIISERDSGISDAFNKGIKIATGEIISILNSDDSYCDPRVFASVAAIFSKNADIQAVHGKILFQDNVYGTNIRAPLLCEIQTAMPVNHPTLFVRKGMYEKYGLFDPEYRYAMDFEWLCRFYDKIAPEALFYFRDFPISIMCAGGASYRRELESLLETQRALRQHGLHNNWAAYHYALRVIRISGKRLLAALALGKVVKFWRYLKWGSYDR